MAKFLFDSLNEKLQWLNCFSAYGEDDFGSSSNDDGDEYLDEDEGSDAEEYEDEDEYYDEGEYDDAVDPEEDGDYDDEEYEDDGEEEYDEEEYDDADEYDEYEDGEEYEDELYSEEDGEEYEDEDLGYDPAVSKTSTLMRRNTTEKTAKSIMMTTLRMRMLSIPAKKATISTGPVPAGWTKSGAGLTMIM